MEILVVGVGDAFSAQHWGTNFLVRAADKVLAVDCPDSYFKALKQADFGITVDDLDGLFLTHLHGDHVNGLEMTLAWRKFVTKKKLNLFTTPEVAATLWEGRLKASIGTMFNGTEYLNFSIEDYANVVVIPWETPTEIFPNLTVETRRTIHHIPTAALRLTTPNARFGHSCDTAFDPALIAWLDQCDLFFHEANFGPAHTPIERLAELPESVRQKMRVVHYADHVQPDDYPSVVFAKQGEKLTLG